MIREKLIYHMIEQNGITKAELARRMGVTRQGLYYIIKNTEDGSDIIPKIAEALNMPLEYLLAGKTVHEYREPSGIINHMGKEYKFSSMVELKNIVKVIGSSIDALKRRD